MELLNFAPPLPSLMRARAAYARTRRSAAFAAFHGVSSLRTFANIRLVRRASRRRFAPL